MCTIHVNYTPNRSRVEEGIFTIKLLLTLFCFTSSCCLWNSGRPDYPVIEYIPCCWERPQGPAEFLKINPLERIDSSQTHSDSNRNECGIEVLVAMELMYCFQTMEDLEERARQNAIEIYVRTNFIDDPANAVRNLKVALLIRISWHHKINANKIL